MGIFEHHAILVTGTFGDWTRRAHEEAQRLFPVVSPIMRSELNDVSSFVIPPDGSFEEKVESEEGDHRRDQFIAWIAAQRYEDGSSPLDWAEIKYGDEAPMITRCSQRGRDPDPNQ